MYTHFTNYVTDTNLIEVYLSIYLALRISYINSFVYSCISRMALSQTVINKNVLKKYTYCVSPQTDYMHCRY
jgi:hypothetical protein